MEETIEDVLRALKRQLEDLRQSAVRTAKAGEQQVEAMHNIGMRLAELEGRLKLAERK